MRKLNPSEAQQCLSNAWEAARMSIQPGLFSWLTIQHSHRSYILTLLKPQQWQHQWIIGSWWDCRWNYCSELWKQVCEAWKIFLDDSDTDHQQDPSRAGPDPEGEEGGRAGVRECGRAVRDHRKPQANSADIPRMGSDPHSRPFREPPQRGCFTPALWPGDPPSLLTAGNGGPLRELWLL